MQMLYTSYLVFHNWKTLFSNLLEEALEQTLFFILFGFFAMFVIFLSTNWRGPWSRFLRHRTYVTALFFHWKKEIQVVYLSWYLVNVW